MANALHLLDPIGATLAQVDTEVEERAPRFQDVQDGPELHRILHLPRRPAPRVDAPAALEVAAYLTTTLAKVPKPFPGALRALQGVGLYEAWSVKGLAGFIRVGGGKMLMSYLAQAVLQASPVMLVAPAQMRPDTMVNFKKYERDWQGPGAAAVHYISTEKLQSPLAGEELDDQGNVVRLSAIEQVRPRILIIDEAHKVASRDNVARRRIDAYIEKYPDTVVICLTGTPFNTSIKDAAVLLGWTHRDQSPLPRDWKELEAWADYLDVKKSSGPRTGVGALLRFLDGDELRAFTAEEDPRTKRKIVRRAVARWIYDTPGVISSQEGKLIDDDGREIGLEILPWHPLHESDAVDDFFLTLRGDGHKEEQEYDAEGVRLYPGWRLPDGTEGEDGLWLAKHADTGGMGVWQRYEPPPPEEYRTARNEWAKWCRKMIKCNRRGIDSAARMMQAVRKGLYDDEGKLEAWDEAKATYKADTGLDEPPTVSEWVSDEAIDSAAAWVKEHKGLVWVRWSSVGERLAERCGIPFYRKGCKDAKTKLHIMQHPGGPAVVSIQSAKEGKNLQGLWNTNLWMCPTGERGGAGGRGWGAGGGGGGRGGGGGGGEHAKTFYGARDEKADFHADFTLQEQKLVYADGEIPSLEYLSSQPGNRWFMQEAR